MQTNAVRLLVRRCGMGIATACSLVGRLDPARCERLAGGDLNALGQDPPAPPKPAPSEWRRSKKRQAELARLPAISPQTPPAMNDACDVDAED